MSVFGQLDEGGHAEDDGAHAWHVGRLWVQFSRITKERRRKGAEERLARKQERRCLSPCRDTETKCPEKVNQEKKDLGSLTVPGTAPCGREGKALRAHSD